MEHQCPNFLSDPIWMEVPWAKTAKMPLDRLADCLARAPAILQRSNLLQFLNSRQQVELVEQLVRECFKIDDMLQQILDEARLTTPGSLYWPVLSQFNNPTDEKASGKLFPVAYQFTDLRTAGLLMLSWASLVILRSGLCHLYDHMDTINPDVIAAADKTVPSCDDRLPPLGNRSDYLSLAHNVCQSVEYCLQEEMMMSGVMLVTPALSFVIGTLKDRPQHAREVAWMRATMDMVPQRGLRLVTYTPA